MPSPTENWQVNVGSGNRAGDGNVSVGSQAGANVSINDRIVTGNHNAVVASGDSAQWLVIVSQHGGNADFIQGGAAACVTGSPRPQFYNDASGLRSGGNRSSYNPNAPLRMTIKPCPYRWLAPKCSRTVPIGGISYTANRGSPPCGDNTQQTDPGGFALIPQTTATDGPATFRIRIYGKLCDERINQQNCPQFRPSDIGTTGVSLSCGSARRHGYTATFAPAGNCGPPQWPTDALRDAYNNGDSRFPPYAAWCDFTVTAN